LAGPGISDYLYYWPSRHAETACGFMVVSTQLPPRNDLLLRWTCSWPTATEDHFSPESHARGTRNLFI